MLYPIRAATELDAVPDWSVARSTSASYHLALNSSFACVLIG